MKILFVGITGPSCSGKTTFIKKLAQKIGGAGLEVIHADDYWDKNFSPPIIKGHKNRELPENLKLDLLFKHLRDLKNGKSTEVPYKVFEVEGGKKIAQPKEIIIVEGFLLFYKKKIRDLFDLKIYIEVSDEEVVKRRTERNRSGKDRGDYYSSVVVSEYRKYGVSAKEQSDIILDGLDSVEKNVSLVFRKIKEYGI